MSFTSRFIKIPVKEYDIKEKELTGKEDLEDTFEMINPFEISQYRKSFDKEKNLDIVIITFKNGNESTCYLKIKEFEALLNSFS